MLINEDEDDQHQRGRPGLIVLRRRGGFRELEDDEWHAGKSLRGIGRIGWSRRSSSRTAAAPSRPAARATASSAPVIIPLRAVGTTTESVVRQRLAPRAKPCLLDRAGNEGEHLLARAGNQRQHHDRQRDRPSPAALMALSRDDEAEDEDAGDDRRHAVQDVEQVPDRGRAPRTSELVRVDGGQDPARDRHQRRDAHDDRACRRARWRSRRWPRLSWDRRSAVRKSRLIELSPLTATLAITRTRTATASTAAIQALISMVRLAARRRRRLPVRAARSGCRVSWLDSMPSPALPARLWTLRTRSRATELKISESTKQDHGEVGERRDGGRRDPHPDTYSRSCSPACRPAGRGWSGCRRCCRSPGSRRSPHPPHAPAPG